MSSSSLMPIHAHLSLLFLSSHILCSCSVFFLTHNLTLTTTTRTCVEWLRFSSFSTSLRGTPSGTWRSWSNLTSWRCSTPYDGLSSSRWCKQWALARGGSLGFVVCLPLRQLESWLMASLGLRSLVARGSGREAHCRQCYSSSPWSPCSVCSRWPRTSGYYLP